MSVPEENVADFAKVPVNGQMLNFELPERVTKTDFSENLTFSSIMFNLS